MKAYEREYPALSLCGLRCGLCPMHHTDAASRCPGCGGEGFYPSHPTCAIVTCAQKHGGVAFCCDCAEYPCARYSGENPYDSFISYRRVKTDFEKLQEIGLDAFRKELDEKILILRGLLENYNDGRRKNFFCIAVNLLELSDIREVMHSLEAETNPADPIKQRAQAAVRLFQQRADERGIALKLNRKK